MQRIIVFYLAIFLTSWTQCSWASIETYSFDTPAQEKTYVELINELRCLVCQNQNLSDSNANLAKDLRTQVHQLIVVDKADKQMVIDYMVARYGDFVLYKPPVAMNTLLLWFAPLLFLALGLLFAVRMMKALAHKES